MILRVYALKSLSQVSFASCKYSEQIAQKQVVLPSSRNEQGLRSVYSTNILFAGKIALNNPLQSCDRDKLFVRALEAITALNLINTFSVSCKIYTVNCVAVVSKISMLKRKCHWRVYRQAAEFQAQDDQNVLRLCFQHHSCVTGVSFPGDNFTIFKDL